MYWSALHNQIDQNLIRFSGLRSETGDDVAKVGTVECRVFVDLPRQEALPQRAEGDEADPELLEGRHDLNRKSTTLAALVDLINRTRTDHIITKLNFNLSLSGVNVENLTLEGGATVAARVLVNAGGPYVSQVLRDVNARDIDAISCSRFPPPFPFPPAVINCK